MGELEKRTLGASIFMWLGLHGCGLGLLLNGYASPRNPVWCLLSGLFRLEIIALEIAAVVVLAAVAYCLVTFLVRASAKPEKSPLPEPAPKVDTNPLPECQPTPKALAEKPAEAVKPEPLPEPKPPEPTAEELKQKAIEQILRGY